MNWKNFLVGSIKRCIFVVGPTASGKSAWALEQAIKFDGSVVNIDSVQCYQGLSIGSSAPTETDKKKAPHYLYSYVQHPDEITAADYVRDFYKLLNENEQIKFPLFITGGTGFYIQALEKGMYDVAPVPIEIRLQLEDELRTNGAEKLHAELIQKDPNSKIHLNDHYRLVRALEIIRFTAKTPSDFRLNNQVNKYQFPFESIKIGFNFTKEIFEERVSKRTKSMIAEGLIDEVKPYVARGVVDWAPLQSVGYKECVSFLRENKTEDWLIENINRSTMRLIKKQKTWFKRDGSILWSNQQQELEQFLS